MAVDVAKICNIKSDWFRLQIISKVPLINVDWIFNCRSVETVVQLAAV